MSYYTYPVGAAVPIAPDPSMSQAHAPAPVGVAPQYTFPQMGAAPQFMVMAPGGRGKGGGKKGGGGLDWETKTALQGIASSLQAQQQQQAAAAYQQQQKDAAEA